MARHYAEAFWVVASACAFMPCQFAFHTVDGVFAWRTFGDEAGPQQPVYLLIYGLTSCVEVEMLICSHGSLDGFGILHSKLLENILNVLCLANESVKGK